MSFNSFMNARLFSGPGPHRVVQCSRGTVQTGCVFASEKDGWGYKYLTTAISVFMFRAYKVTLPVLICGLWDWRASTYFPCHACKFKDSSLKWWFNGKEKKWISRLNLVPWWWRSCKWWSQSHLYCFAGVVLPASWFPVLGVYECERSFSLTHFSVFQMSMWPACIWPLLMPTWRSFPTSRQNIWVWTKTVHLNQTTTGTVQHVFKGDVYMYSWL